MAEALLLVGGLVLAADVTATALTRASRERGWVARVASGVWLWALVVWAIVDAGVWPHALFGGCALAAGIAWGRWAGPSDLKRSSADRGMAP